MTKWERAQIYIESNSWRHTRSLNLGLLSNLRFRFARFIMMQCWQPGRFAFFSVSYDWRAQLTELMIHKKAAASQVLLSFGLYDPLWVNANTAGVRDVVKELGNWIMCYKFGFTTDLIVVHITKTNCHNFKKEFRNLIIADKADLQLEGTSMIWLWIPAALAFNDENHSGCFLLDRLRSCLCSVFWLPSSICGSKEKWWLFMLRNLIHIFFSCQKIR